MMTAGAFSGLRVYDASTGVAGPHCTSLMAQAGAEVIKVEAPTGDWGRHIGQSFGGQGTFFLTYNRGKKSVTLDLKNQGDVSKARSLIATCDVVVESFRPGVMKRLGLDYESFCEQHKDLVYLSISGFGQLGPSSGDAALDTIMQAFAGWMHINRDREGTPVLMDHIGVDVLTGLYAFQACTAALLKRFRSGGGSYLDVSLLNSAIAYLSPRVTEYVLSAGAMQDSTTPPTGVWPTSDGAIALAVKDQKQFSTLCTAIGLPDLAADPTLGSRDLRMAAKSRLRQEIGAVLKNRKQVELVSLLKSQQLPAAIVNGFAEIMTDPQVIAANIISATDQPGLGQVPVVNTPGFDRNPTLGPAPALGEHNDEILSSFTEF